MRFMLLLALSPYFGLEPPAGVPGPFAPPMLAPFSTTPGLTATSPASSPDFRRFTFTIVDTRTAGKVALDIHETMPEGGEWSEPAPQPSPDDAVLFFLRRVDGVDRIFSVRLSTVLEAR
jgi:hypothetical protein